MNLKELSEKLGLSQTTVSRALNGYPEVAEATRLRVTKAAAEANYTPSNRARSLATGRAMAIGHVLTVSSKLEMVNPIFGDFIAGAGEVYSRSGYDMLLSLVTDDAEENVYRTMKSKGNVDGIVVHGPRMNDKRIALLTDLGLPFVVHGRASEVDIPHSWLDVPNTRAFSESTQHLIDLGHKHIALINGEEHLDFAFRRREGFEQAMAQAKLPCCPEWMSSAPMSESEGFRAASAMLALTPAPTAFVTASLITALGVERAIAHAGLKMGQDVSVLTFDDELSYLHNVDEDNVRFTAMRSSVHQAGQILGQMLLNRIANPAAPHGSHMMEVKFVKGQSTAPAPE